MTTSSCPKSPKKESWSRAQAFPQGSLMVAGTILAESRLPFQYLFSPDRGMPPVKEEISEDALEF